MKPIRPTTVRTFLAYLLLVAVSLVLIMPFVWIISTSLKGNESIFAIPPKWIPETLHWENYAKVFTQMPFFTYMRNSVFISVVVILGTVLSSSLVAYAFACLKWPGRDGLFIFVLGTMMLPMQVTMIPVFVLFKQFGWLNTFKPLIVPAFFGGGAFNIFLLRQFFLTIPKELFEAARIDGCSEWRIYWKIVLPLAKPALATVAILTFMMTWNDFLGPLIYLSDKLKGTLALGLAMFVGQYQTEWGVLMAASVLVMLPVIFLFFLFQKYFIRGFMMSGIKG
ncbi:MAG: sugar ABC transporter ATP-binding protein [Candidatus Marinimicrobia bacterium CG08_land_8_20_14_0_20_45_22]|nr:MAG: sugar ABC transporter ATP-binding protein [Candidatus Marinimicrobia bacterium CG08_land_8_20_14_0_20_45_22]